MKKLLIPFLIVTAAAYGQTAKKNAKKTTAPAVSKQAQAITIPGGAVLGEDGSYRLTDKQGKAWLYRNTPFGVSRVEDKPVAKSAQPAGPEMTRATVLGDTVQFERPNAFGVSRWEKKTSELTDDEKKIVENQKAKQE